MLKFKESLTICNHNGQVTNNFVHVYDFEIIFHISVNVIMKFIDTPCKCEIM
jgi:hypothetical protein